MKVLYIVDLSVVIGDEDSIDSDCDCDCCSVLDNEAVRSSFTCERCLE